MLITFAMIIGLDFTVRDPARSVSDFGSIGSGDCYELSLDRDGTLRARWNAHRNVRLTRVGIEGKMPIEQRFSKGGR